MLFPTHRRQIRRLLPREPLGSEGRGGRNLFTAMRDVARNPHARILLFVFFIESFGVGGTSVMAPYVVKYVIELEGILGIVLLAYVVPTAVSIPILRGGAGLCGAAS